MEEAKKEIVERENNNLEKWRRIYAGGDPDWVYWNPKYYDLVINTYANDADASFRMVLDELEKHKA